MKRLYCIGLLLATAVIIQTCRKPYAPAAISANNNYLVVEGTVESGSDSTFIKLSTTVKLNSAVTSSPLLHAAVMVERDDNADYPLTETTYGYYTSAGLNLDATRKYRLKIKIASKEYLSDLVPVLNSPPIDSITYAAQNNGVQLYVNTHDVKNSTRYYRWDFGETWRFHSNFESFYKSNGDTVLARDIINDEIYDCWQSDTASSIYLGTSAKLANDVIAESPLTFIPSSSEKIGTRYSILVRQYALSKEEYSFWQNIKKNSEQLGSIFDAQPSEIAGNIHSVTNPSEPVLGYVSVGRTSTRRIFIDNSDLPHWETIPFYQDCKPQRNCCLFKFRDEDFGPYYNQVDAYINYNKGADPRFALIPIVAIVPGPGQPPIGFTAATRQCVDCTLRGTNKAPAFWKIR